MRQMMSQHILVVDDDPMIRETVAEILDFEGYSIETAANGREALQAMEQSPPSLVLLDMRMPILDGWGFARKVKERGLQVSIVVMTAARNAGRWAAEIDADGYLAKPFDLADLLATIDRLYRPD